MERVCGVLRSSEQKNLLNVWSDIRLEGGDAWEAGLRRQIDLAQGILVIASRSYLSSDFVKRKEWPWIVDRLDNGASLFWVPQDLPADGGGIDDPGARTIWAELRKYQAAHNKPDSLDDLLSRSRSGDALHDALLLLRHRIEKWASEGSRVTIDQSTEDETTADVQAEAAYLDLMYDTCRYLRIANLGEKDESATPGTGGRPRDKKVHRLRLESVYVTLEADPTTVQERLQTRALYHELAAAGMGESDDRWPWREISTPDLVAEIVRSREGRHAPSPIEEMRRTGERLESMFRRERVMVVLGDPGSGKSVLCRWIAYQMASQLSEHRDQEGDLAELGPARLPILIRVSAFANHIKDGGDADLYEYLGKHTEWDEADYREMGLTPQLIGAICRRAIREQRAVVLVDGLDEVIEAKLRGRVCDAIEAFITQRIYPEQQGAIREALRAAPPGQVGKNQIVLTSRVTGYHLAPLRLETAAHFLIRPLEDAQIRELCKKLGEFIDRNRPAGTPGATGERFLAALERRNDRSLERLKRNPLLLTSLLSYFERHQNLPPTRASLYRSLILDLSAHWRLNEPHGGQNKALVASLASGPELRAKLQEQGRDTDSWVLRLLGSVAEVSQQTSSSGQITRRELTNCLEDVLPRLLGIDPLRDPVSDRAIRIYVRRLLDLVAEQLGVMVETGTNVYRFLHLTIQEYLVGWILVDTELAREAASAESFTERILERVEDPRWREALLFAFGELARRAAQGVPALSTVLQRLRENLADKSDESVLFLADLIGEVEADRLEVDTIAEVLTGLFRRYRECGPKPVAERRRWRIAEKIAELRRSPALCEKVDVAGLRILRDVKELSAPVAHLFWDRRWLSSAVLRAFAEAQSQDQAAWGWPMHTALRQSLAENRHIDAEPLIDPKAPSSDGDAAAQRAARLLESVYPVWRQKRSAFDERRYGTDHENRVLPHFR
jgi:hypothetical protein